MNSVNRQNIVTEKEARTANSTYPKGGVSCSKDSFVVKQSLVLRINPSRRMVKIPHLRQAAKRYASSFRRNHSLETA
jgi:hypothetical protein